MRTQTTYAWWSFQPQQKSKLPGLLIFLGAAGLAWWWFSRPPDISEQPQQDWSGVWYRTDGQSLIRLRGERGEFSPDGMSVIPFRARTEGNNLWFPATVNDRFYTLCLMRSGETARLVGTPEYDPVRRPLRNGVKAANANTEELRRQATKAALLPVDMGTFRRQ
jgi:hypothetical protein